MHPGTPSCNSLVRILEGKGGFEHLTRTFVAPQGIFVDRLFRLKAKDEQNWPGDFLGSSLST